MYENVKQKYINSQLYTVVPPSAELAEDSISIGNEATCLDHYENWRPRPFRRGFNLYGDIRRRVFV